MYKIIVNEDPIFTNRILEAKRLMEQHLHEFSATEKRTTITISFPMLPKNDHHCKDVIIDRYTGSIVRCGKCEGHPGPHQVDGFIWNNGFERHFCPTGSHSGSERFKIDELWLTNGGRVVKPGLGECAGENFGDFMILSIEQLQSGVGWPDFVRQLSKGLMKRHGYYLKIVKSKAKKRRR